MKALLELQGVRVVADGNPILHVEHLAIEPGATLGVLGANGAGKSTLLRVAGCLRRRERGELLLDGRPAGTREIRAATAAVLQQPLLRRGTVRANVCTGLRFRGTSRAEARRRAAPWIDRLGLAVLAGRAVSSLSGGEMQRVSLARALALSPRLLLLDEPFSALDGPTRWELVADLADLLGETATAAMFVTHDPHEAVAVAGRIVIMVDGRVRQLGSVEEVMAAPADPECARLLGFENVVTIQGGTIALRAPDLRPLSSGEAPGDGAAVLAVRFRRAVPLGPDVQLRCELGAAPVLVQVPLEGRAWLRDLTPGEPLALAYRRDAARPVGDGPPPAPLIDSNPP